MIIASVPHTGSRFVQRLLGGTVGLWHVYSKGESLEEIRKHNPIIVPLRHPLATAQSWKNRGKPIVEHPLHEPMLAMWRTLIDVVDGWGPVYLPVDSPRREEYLKRLGEVVGRKLDTDWAPISDNRDYVPLTDYERLVAVELMNEPFFARFY